MAKGIPGADTLAPITNNLIARATAFFGQTPRFWGRYFSTAADSPYQPAGENPVFNANNIRVLPIARQTNHVDGDEATGKTDGANNAEAMIAAFGADVLATQGTEFLMFLDVEGPPSSSLSVDYYTGWSQALSAKSKEISGNRFELKPGVYALTRDKATWDALRACAALGVKCHAAWVARLHNDACDNGFVDWEPDFALPTGDLPCPVLAWQFAQNCPDSQGIDADQTNADEDGEAFLKKLILPPL